MEFIESLVGNSTFYYVLVTITYVLVIIFVVMLLINSKRKKRLVIKTDNSKKKDLESVDLEAVLDKMQEDVEVSKDEPVLSFEQEQEEKAIISYQELLNAVKKDVNEVTSVNSVSDNVEVFSDPIEEQELPTLNKITTQDNNALEPVVLANEEDIEVSQPEDIKQNNTTGFQNSEFISPIYGRVNNKIEYPKIPAFRENKTIKEEPEDNLDKTRVFSPVKDINNNDEFLKALKEFRNNLE